MRAITGKPIKLLGVGEKMDAIEDFHPARLADRILGMGDIVSLVEKAAQSIDMAQAAKMAEKMRKGVFDLNDLSDQLAQHEDPAKIQFDSRRGPQPFQSGASSRQARRLQTQTLSRAG